MRPCRGRDAGSARAVAAQARLCWCPASLYRRPLPPSWGLAARGAPPRARRRETIRVRGGAPSVRKPSLAIREGALGYRTPQPLPLPSARWPPWRLPEHVGRTPPHLPSGVGEGAGAPAPRLGPCAARCLPRPAPPPFELGEGPAGPRRASGRWRGTGARVVPCARARGRPPRCGEPWGKGGEVLGARRPVGPGFPSPVAVVRESLSRPPSPHEPQPVAACGHGRGRLA